MKRRSFLTKLLSGAVTLPFVGKWFPAPEYLPCSFVGWDKRLDEHFILKRWDEPEKGCPILRKHNVKFAGCEYGIFQKFRMNKVEKAGIEPA